MFHYYTGYKITFIRINPFARRGTWVLKWLKSPKRNMLHMGQLRGFVSLRGTFAVFRLRLVTWGDQTF